MLNIILNRLKPQEEKITAKKQEGFTAGRSTTEIFNLRILCEKYFQHQQDLYHVYIHFRKAFDRVWHAALWETMKKYNISANLIRVIKHFILSCNPDDGMNVSFGALFFFFILIWRSFGLFSLLFYVIPVTA